MKAIGAWYWSLPACPPALAGSPGRVSKTCPSASICTPVYYARLRRIALSERALNDRGCCSGSASPERHAGLRTRATPGPATPQSSSAAVLPSLLRSRGDRLATRSPEPSLAQCRASADAREAWRSGSIVSVGRVHHCCLRWVIGRGRSARGSRHERAADQGAMAVNAAHNRQWIWMSCRCRKRRRTYRGC